jgi:hypothetical protein
MKQILNMHGETLSHKDDINPKENEWFFFYDEEPFRGRASLGPILVR